MDLDFLSEKGAFKGIDRKQIQSSLKFAREDVKRVKGILRQNRDELFKRLPGLRKRLREHGLGDLEDLIGDLQP